MLKVCSGCRKPKDISQFSICRTSKDGRQGKCKPCSNLFSCLYAIQNRSRRTEYFRQYRATPKGAEATRNAIARYEAKNKDRRLAWNLAKEIPRKPCRVCGRKDSVRHHPDISKPLKVVMLCHFHHKQAHHV